MRNKQKLAVGITAGYTVCFLKAGRISQITMADASEAAIERSIVASFGAVEVLSRTPVDARVLEILRLSSGEWIEWKPVRSGNPPTEGRRRPI